MCKQVSFYIGLNVEGLTPKLARNEVGIDRAGLYKFLKKEFSHVLVKDGLPQTKISYGHDCVAVFGRTSQTHLRKVKDILDCICKYNECVDFYLYREFEVC